MLEGGLGGSRVGPDSSVGKKDASGQSEEATLVRADSKSSGLGRLSRRWEKG